ncbi:MAG: hypothetical protein AAGF24_05290 [Cyanobacteria bacterium P01_H01_bin.121]
MSFKLKVVVAARRFGRAAPYIAVAGASVKTIFFREYIDAFDITLLAVAALTAIVRFAEYRNRRKIPDNLRLIYEGIVELQQEGWTDIQFIQGAWWGMPPGAVMPLPIDALNKLYKDIVPF